MYYSPTVLRPGFFGDASLLEPPEQPVVCFWRVNLILSRNLAPKGPTPVCFLGVDGGGVSDAVVYQERSDPACVRLLLKLKTVYFS